MGSLISMWIMKEFHFRNITGHFHRKIVPKWYILIFLDEVISQKDLALHWNNKIILSTWDDIT